MIIICLIHIILKYIYYIIFFIHTVAVAVIHNVICYGNKLLLFSEWQLARSFEIKLVWPYVVARVKWAAAAAPVD